MAYALANAHHALYATDYFSLVALPVSNCVKTARGRLYKTGSGSVRRGFDPAFD